MSASYDASLDVSAVATGEKLCSLVTGGAVQQAAWQPRAGSRLVAIARDSKGDKATDARYARTDFVRLVNVPDFDLKGDEQPRSRSPGASASSRRMRD